MSRIVAFILPLMHATIVYGLVLTGLTSPGGASPTISLGIMMPGRRAALAQHI